MVRSTVTRSNGYGSRPKKPPARPIDRSIQQPLEALRPGPPLLRKLAKLVQQAGFSREVDGPPPDQRLLDELLAAPDVRLWLGQMQSLGLLDE